MKKLLAILFLFVSSIGFAQHQHTNYVTASGTDTYAVTISTPTIANYSNKRIHIKFANANTGASTINVTPSGASALGAVAIRAWDGDSWEALTGGEIDPEIDYLLIYSGSYFKLCPLAGSGGGSANTGELENVDIAGTTYTITDADAGKLLHLIHASGTTVTMDDAISADKIFYFRRDEGAGVTTFDDDGTSVLLTPGGADPTIEVEGGEAQWSKRNATDFEGVGMLGSDAGSGDFLKVDGTTTTAIGDTDGNFTGNKFVIREADSLRFETENNTTIKVNSVDGLIFEFEGAEKLRIANDWSIDGDAGTAGYIVTSNGAGSSPSWQAPGGIGDGDKGDITVSASGATWTIDNLAVTAAKLATLSSSDLAGKLTDETGGSGVAVFSASPALTGTPTAPTAAPGTNTTQIATTAFVADAVTGGSVADGDKGDITVSSSGTVWTVDNSAITNAKINDVAVGKITGLGTGVATWLATPSWANFNSAITGTAPYWSLASGGAQTADNTISGAFKTSFTTNSVGIGNSGTHAARLDVQGSGSTNATSALVVGSGTDASILTVRDDGIIYMGLGTSSLAVSTYKTIYTSPWAYSTGATRIQGFEGTSHYLGSAGVRIAAHTAGTPQSSSGNGLYLQSFSDYMWLSSTTTGLGSSNRKYRFDGLHQASAGSVTSTIFEILNGVDNATTPQSNISLIGIDYNPTNSGTITNHYAAIFRSGFVGIGTATPVSTFDVSGSNGAAITSTSTDITLDVTHYTVLVDASGATRTITLPAAAGCTRRIYTIKKIDSSGNVVTIDGNASETIDGATTSTLAAQWNTKVIQSNGTSWFITSSF